MNIEGLIANMAMRPPMYVYPVNVYSIENFLGGYLYRHKGDIATYKFDVNSVNCVFSSFIDRWVYQWIRRNINKRFDRNGSIMWPDMLTAVTNSEAEAVELFFKLSKEFFKDFHEKDAKYWDGVSF